MPITAKLDEFGKPAWIALIVLGFMAFWPLGLAILAFTIWSGRMGCGYHGGPDRWQHKMERMQRKMDWMRAKMGGNPQGGSPWSGGPWGGTPSSGNRAFDEYRTETLSRLEDEQREFRTSSSACAWPRTRPSSTSSWPSVATARPRTRPRRKVDGCHAAVA